ncbi:MAG: hypothetical protein HQ541_15340, partial [Mariniphaga sp.]|nr:hypothetical protein [Mariniphaga sp.]
MILFFKTPQESIIAVGSQKRISEDFVSRLNWLFGGAELLQLEVMKGWFIGPRKEMLTPWSTNAVEIT